MLEVHYLSAALLENALENADQANNIALDRHDDLAGVEENVVVEIVHSS